MRAETYVDSTLDTLTGEAHFRLSTIDHSSNVRSNCIDVRVQLDAESLPAMRGSDRTPR